MPDQDKCCSCAVKMYFNLVEKLLLEQNVGIEETLRRLLNGFMYYILQIIPNLLLQSYFSTDI